MAEQNYKNHRRFLIPWHIVTGLLVGGILGFAIANVFKSTKETLVSSLMMLAVAFVLSSFFIFIRFFALKAQDRAIRAEESLRHFILIGKPIDKQLRLGQIIALRFASDEELPALAKKAVAEKLSSKQIKESIQNWKGDYHRV